MVPSKGKSCFTYCLGYSKEELESISFVGFIHSEDMKLAIKEVENLRKTKTISFENRYRCKKWSVCSVAGM
jgi:hypothetical protein